MSPTNTATNESQLFRKINADLLMDRDESLKLSDGELEIIRSRFNDRAEHWKKIYNDTGHLSKPGLGKACMSWMNSIKLNASTLFFFPDHEYTSEDYVSELFGHDDLREYIDKKPSFANTPVKARYLYVARFPFPCNAAAAFHHVLSEFASRNGLYKEFRKKILLLSKKSNGTPSSLYSESDDSGYNADRFYGSGKPEFALPLRNALSKLLITLSECIYYSIDGYSYLDPFPVTSSMSSRQYSNSLSHLANAIDCGLENVSVHGKTLVFTSVGKFAFDKDNRPHNESGPAVKYMNGEEEYYIDGVSVDKKTVIAPHKLNARDVILNRNQEAKRIMTERMGIQNFLKSAGARLLDKRERSNGNFELYRAEIENDEPMVMVKVICSSTSREYFLRVPPTMTSVDEAVAWTYGLTEVEYQPIFES
jgi:hypothetical protein